MQRVRSAVNELLLQLLQRDEQLFGNIAFLQLHASVSRRCEHSRAAAFIGRGASVSLRSYERQGVAGSNHAIEPQLHSSEPLYCV